MKEIERQITDNIFRLKNPGLDDHSRYEIEKKVESLLSKVCEEPFGEATQEFLFNEELGNFLSSEYSNKFRNIDKIKLKLLLEIYLITSDSNLRKRLLQVIENKVLKIKQKLFDPAGQRLFTSEVINKTLIRDVYLSNDNDLSELFSKHLPTPGVEFFAGYPTPAFIKKRAGAATEAVLKFLRMRALKGIDYLSTESEIINVQRKFRVKRRQREEISRITQLQSKRDNKDDKEKKEINEQHLTKEAVRALADANTPYTPKIPEGIQPELADKIINAAKKVKLFSSIHHLTSAKSLENIFNDSLYGRKTLLQKYLPFEPAALQEYDLLYGGDANVICFGPQEIDPLAIQKDAIDIVLDLDKLPDNPCIFYKQRDLGFTVKKFRELRIGNQKTIFFSHTSPHYWDKDLNMDISAEDGFTDFRIFDGVHKKLIGHAKIPNYNLIAYNIPKMHQILTLNFFRFLDNLKKPTGEPNEDLIREIYSSIAKLDEKQLVEFLQDIGRKTTDTAEFNFYGAYKIDFSAIESISTVHKRKSQAPVSRYKIELKAFIEELNSGNDKQMQEAMENIPTLFKSYRFLEYLTSQVHHKGIQQKLLMLRKGLPAPLWISGLEKIRGRNEKHLLEKELLSKIALLGTKEAKEKVEEIVHEINTLQGKMDLRLEDKLLTGRTLAKEIEISDTVGPLKEKLFAIFKPSKPAAPLDL